MFGISLLATVLLIADTAFAAKRPIFFVIMADDLGDARFSFQGCKSQ